jgi:hypothetical protein
MTCRLTVITISPGNALFPDIRRHFVSILSPVPATTNKQGLKKNEQKVKTGVPDTVFTVLRHTGLCYNSVINHGGRLAWIILKK